MTNIIQFPIAAAGSTPNRAASTSHDPAEHGHSVQFYDDPDFLFDTVAGFFAPGVALGDRLIVVAQRAHRDDIRKHIELRRGEHAFAPGQLTMIDAEEMLQTVLVDGFPNAELFHAALARLVAASGARPDTRIRVYGEMVDVLWREGNAAAAIRLEELWNEAQKTRSFSLLCSYPMRHFQKEEDAARFAEVCLSHGHVMPTESYTRLAEPHAQLRAISALQQRAQSLESEIHQRKEVESALIDALKERRRVEDDLRASLEREKEARAQAEASDAFKEVFLAILGHDLRNPLNTVLTTARLMVMRGEVPQESRKRLERVVVSGVRMERMIDQLLDLTRARLAGGVPVRLGAEQDVVPLVTKILAEMRVAHPTRTFELRTEGPCPARVDGDRFEQVASNLLGNAVAHGDPERPITVTMAASESGATLTVHNHGVPIDPAFMPLLFDPFKRGKRPRDGRPGGLGLGLYITERIVTAHGGTVTVESTREAGTTFEVRLFRGP